MRGNLSRILRAIAIRINRPHSLIHLCYARQSSDHIFSARLHFSSFFPTTTRSINYGATLGNSAPLTYFYHAQRSQLSMRNSRKLDARIFARNTSAHTLHAPQHFRTLARFSLEKPKVSRYANTRPRGKIQILAASAPRDGKLSFAHFCISFITSRRENAYGIVSEMSARPEGRASMSYFLLLQTVSFRVFDFSICRVCRRAGAL